MTEVNDEQKIKQTLHEVLLKVKSKQRPTLAICVAVIHELGDHHNKIHVDKVMDYLENIFPKWEKFSGNKNFPVPHPAYPDDRNAAQGVYFYVSAVSFWSGEYGHLRKELLDFCIKETAPNEE